MSRWTLPTGHPNDTPSVPGGISRFDDEVAELFTFPSRGPATQAAVSDNVRSLMGNVYTGPTLPVFAPGTRYVWTKTDAVTGDLIDIITGVAS